MHFYFLYILKCAFFSLKTLKTLVSNLWIRKSTANNYLVQRVHILKIILTLQVNPSIQTQHSLLMLCWTMDWFPNNDMNHDLNNLLHCQLLGSLRREETTEVSNTAFDQAGAPNNTELKSGDSGLCCFQILEKKLSFAWDIWVCKILVCFSDMLYYNFSIRRTA